MSSHPGLGTEQDYTAWFKESARWMLRWACYYTRDRRSAEDLAQEAAIKVYKAWDDEAKRGKVLTSPNYVRAIIRNCFLDHEKGPGRAARREVQLDIGRHDTARTETSHDDLLSAVLNLDVTEQDMIVLRYYDNLTISEVGRPARLVAIAGIPAARQNPAQAGRAPIRRGGLRWA